MRDYEAIERLCKIFKQLPQQPWGQYDIIQFASFFCGVPAQPTGLPVTDDRPIKQLYWDATVADIRQRLCGLAAPQSVDEELLVMGLVACVKRLLTRMSDPASVERTAQHNLKLIEELEAAKHQPQSARRGNLSDEMIERMLKTCRQAVANLEVNRRSAEEVSEALDKLIDDRLGRLFWEQYDLWHMRRDAGD